MKLTVWPDEKCGMCKTEANSERVKTVSVRMPGPGQEDYAARDWICHACGWLNRRLIEARDASTIGGKRSMTGPIRPARAQMGGGTK